MWYINNSKTNHEVDSSFYKFASPISIFQVNDSKKNDLSRGLNFEF